MNKVFYIALSAILTLILFIEGYASPKNPFQIRVPAVAGSFYPASETELRNVIKEMLDKIPQKNTWG